MVFVIYYGLAGGLKQSLGYIPGLGKYEITLRYYKELLRDPEFSRSLLFTLRYTVIATALSVALGVLGAQWLRSFKKTEPAELIIRIPVVIPFLAASLYTILVFSSTGFIARILNPFGLTFQGFTGEENGIGIILTFIWKSTPYVMLTVFALLRKMSGTFEEVSENLGAGKIRTFFTITLPLIKEEVLTVTIILFSFIFGSYEVPMLLGPTSPKAISVFAHHEYLDPLMESRARAMAASLLQTVCGIFIALLLLFLFKGRRIRHEKKKI